MTLYEFNRLELNERIEAVNQYGTCLDNYITKDIRIDCYAIDKFFVEVVYDVIAIGVNLIYILLK